MNKELDTNKKLWSFIEENVPSQLYQQNFKQLNEFNKFIQGYKCSIKGISIEAAVILRNEVLFNLYQEAINNFVSESSITGTVSLRNYAETITDIAYEGGARGFRPTGNSRDTIDTIISWANEFTRHHQNTDWNEVEYLDTVYEFTDQKLKQQSQTE